MATIADNLQQMRLRIVHACARAGRDPDSVTLLAVSKTRPADAVRQAAVAGQLAFGENYIQEALGKMRDLQDVDHLQWHCIGPVQGNKTRLAAENFSWVQTVDRLKTAQRLSAQRPAHLPALQVCIQVNVDSQDSKSGVSGAEMLPLAKAVASMPRLCLRGLMSIPMPRDDFGEQLQVHQRTRALFGEAAEALGRPPHFDTLSMGMSDDLEAAILAGSTMVRVGTAIFGERASRG